MRRREFLKRSLLAGAGAAWASVWPLRAWGLAPKKILVLGGTLFLGPALVEALVANGHTVTLFNRGVTHPELFPYLERLRGFRSADANDQDLTALAHRKFDVIVDVWPNDPDMVATAAQFLKDRAQHYLFVSSVAAYDGKEWSQPAMNEDTPLEPFAARGARTTATRRRASGGCMRLSGSGSRSCVRGQSKATVTIPPTC